MSCMSLSGVIASATQFAASLAVTWVMRFLRTAARRCFAQRFLALTPASRFARKSAHLISFLPLSLSMPGRRSAWLRASAPCAVVHPAQAYPAMPGKGGARLAMASAAVECNKGRLQSRAMWWCTAARTRLCLEWRVGHCSWQREHPGLSRTLVAGRQATRQVRGMSSRPRMPVSKNLRSL